MDKHEAMIEYIQQCPVIAANPTYFNFAEGEDNTKQLIVLGNDKSVAKPYIDGSVLRKYTLTIVDYRSVAYQALVNVTGYSNESVAELQDVQSIIDWVNEQEELKNYPDFGTDCVIDKVESLSDTPKLNGVDHSTTPNLAKYSISIQVTYLDKSKMIWNG